MVRVSKEKRKGLRTESEGDSHGDKTKHEPAERTTNQPNKMGLMRGDRMEFGVWGTG
jgi:hypothetical protein